MRVKPCSLVPETVPGVIVSVVNVPVTRSTPLMKPLAELSVRPVVEAPVRPLWIASAEVPSVDSVYSAGPPEASGPRQ